MNCRGIADVRLERRRAARKADARNRPHQRVDGTPFPEAACPLFRSRAEGEPCGLSTTPTPARTDPIFPVAYSAAPLRSGSDVKGVVVVFRDITEETAEHARVQRELAHSPGSGASATRSTRQRLVLYSQPIVPLRGGLRREELLLRMIGRDDELIPPGSFLPVAERFGLIGEIDRWVIDPGHPTRRHGAARRGEPLGSLDRTSRPPSTDRAADPHGRCRPGQPRLRDHRDRAHGRHRVGRSFAARLGEIGCGFALDDFGTGFGSFTYLKQLPVTYLKIDIEFVREIVTNQANQHLTKAIVGLAQVSDIRRSLKASRTRQTVELLRQLGVDYAQGFIFGRPAPVTDAGPQLGTLRVA